VKELCSPSELSFPFPSCLNSSPPMGIGNCVSRSSPMGGYLAVCHYECVFRMVCIVLLVVFLLPLWVCDLIILTLRKVRSLLDRKRGSTLPAGRQRGSAFNEASIPMMLHLPNHAVGKKLYPHDALSALFIIFVKKTSQTLPNKYSPILILQCQVPEHIDLLYENPLCWFYYKYY
jgi:hypothetical protein